MSSGRWSMRGWSFQAWSFRPWSLAGGAGVAEPVIDDLFMDAGVIHQDGAGIGQIQQDGTQSSGFHQDGTIVATIQQDGTASGGFYQDGTRAGAII